MSQIVGTGVHAELRKLAQQHEWFTRRVEGIYCPNCDKAYEIVPSRMELTKPRIHRALFTYYHCRICECRFCRPKSWLRTTVMWALIGLAVFSQFLWLIWR